MRGKYVCYKYLQVDMAHELCRYQLHLHSAWFTIHPRKGYSNDCLTVVGSGSAVPDDHQQHGQAARAGGEEVRAPTGQQCRGQGAVELGDEGG